MFHCIELAMTTCALWKRYGLWNAEHDDVATFNGAMDALCGEIGERARISTTGELVVLPVAQPPQSAPEEAPPPAPAQAPTLSPKTLAVAPQPNASDGLATDPAHVSDQRPFATERVQPTGLAAQPTASQASAPSLPLQTMSNVSYGPESSASIVEVSAFLELAERISAQAKTERHESLELAEKIKSQAKTERQETAAELRRDLTPSSVVTDGQLADVQSRLEVLYSSKLISESVLFVATPDKALLHCSLTQ